MINFYFRSLAEIPLSYAWWNVHLVQYMYIVLLDNPSTIILLCLYHPIYKVNTRLYCLQNGCWKMLLKVTHCLIYHHRYFVLYLYQMKNDVSDWDFIGIRSLLGQIVNVRRIDIHFSYSEDAVYLNISARNMTLNTCK